jgi:hypothetical protein
VNELREADVAASFGSSFWWLGPAVDAEDTNSVPTLTLPSVEVAQLTADPVSEIGEQTADITSLSYALLSVPARERLSVTCAGGTFARALKTVAQVLPEALSGLSVSTYEGRPTLPFNVVGVTTTTPGRRTCDLSAAPDLEPAQHTVLAELLGEGPSAQRLRAAVRRHADGMQSPREAVWPTATALMAAATGGGSTQTLTDVLGDPHTLVYIVGATDKLDSVAQVIVSGKRRVRDSLRLAWTQLGAGEQARLSDAVLATYRRSGDLTECTAIAACLGDPRAASAFVESVLEIALVQPSAAATLGAADAVTVLTRAASGSGSAEPPKSLLHATSRHIADCAQEPRVPTAFVTVMLLHQLATGIDPTRLARVLHTRREALVGCSLNDVQQRHAAHCLSHLGADALLDVLPSALPAITDPEPIATLHPVLLTLPAAPAGRSLLMATRGATASPELGRLCDAQAANVLRAAVRTRGISKLAARSMALELLAVRPSRPGIAAAQVLRAIGARWRPGAEELSRAASEIQDNRLRNSLLEFAFAAATEQMRSDADGDRLWHELQVVYPGETAEGHLGRVLWLCEREPNDGRDALVLSWIARRVLESEPSLVTNFGRLRSRELDGRARSIAVSLPAWCLEREDQFIGNASRRGRQWWKDLTEYARKLASAENSLHHRRR